MVNEKPLDAKTLGRRLRRERKRLALTQGDVADLAGVTHVTVYQYEKGQRRPSLNFLLDIQPAGVNLQFLLFGKHRVIAADDRFVDADLASELYRLVDRYAVDSKGRSLHLDSRVALFDELVSMALNLGHDEVDTAPIQEVLREFAA